MLRLLIVDDEKDVCDFAKGFFEERGYEVITAFSGNDALRAVKRFQPSLVLLDVHMQGIDGLETLKRIKEINREIEVIMVTAVEDQGRIDAAFKLGASSYVTKPLVLEELEDIVLKKAVELNNGKRT